jgi:NTP pyrophosphatase (non-canonical NTP hydrolase)
MYFIYHIPGKKIGVTRNLNKRVTIAQGYQPGEYEVLESSEDINYVSKRESELQLLYGYKLDRDSYKKVINKHKKQQPMKLNVTEQTTTFPCPVNKLRGQLMDAIGLNFTTPYGSYILDTDMAEWIVKNASMSMFNSSRSYVYNKALSEYVKARNIAAYSDANSLTRSINSQLEEAFSNFFEAMQTAENKPTPSDNIYSLIREWARNRGIYTSGDSKTQYVKLMEEAGELAQAILRKDKAEIKDAIGDMIVVLTNLAYLEGLNVEDCVDSAYNEIKDRKGSMANGTFVKNNEINMHGGARITLD